MAIRYKVTRKSGVGIWSLPRLTTEAAHPPRIRTSTSVDTSGPKQDFQGQSRPRSVRDEVVHYRDSLVQSGGSQRTRSSTCVTAHSTSCPSPKLVTHAKRLIFANVEGKVPSCSGRFSAHCGSSCSSLPATNRSHWRMPLCGSSWQSSKGNSRGRSSIIEIACSGYS